MVVIAVERTYFPLGVEKRGGDQEKELAETRLATPWNHIEAAMGYVKPKPLLVIVQNGLKSEGLLEPGYDWYVQTVALEPNSTTTNEFNGVLASWKAKILDSHDPEEGTHISAAALTVGQLLHMLKPAQVWSILTAARTELQTPCSS